MCVNPFKVEWMRKDGDYVHKGLKFGKVSGNAHKIVVSERVVLNFMQRMSGIATLTKVIGCGYFTVITTCMWFLIRRV